jgi:signal peptidase II
MTNISNTSSRAKFTDPIPWIVMLSALLIDQLTKWLTIENLARGESWPADGFFRFTHAWNTGTAFSLFQGQGDILTWVSVAAVAVLAWIYKSIANPPWVLRIAFGLQLGGAIGNLVDRFRLGHVTDFIDVGPWPIFNIADSSILVGIALMVFYFWFLDAGSKKKAEPAAAVPDAGSPGPGAVQPTRADTEPDLAE